MRPSIRVILVLIALLGSIGAQSSGQLFQGPFGLNGRWHVYELVEDETTWRDAADRVLDAEYDGVAGHLVDVLSAEENAFLEWITAGSVIWIGLTDREGAAPDRMQRGLPSPQESSGLGNPRTDGWAWTSGAPFEFNNWQPGEPRDYNGAEDAVQLRTDGRWNDASSGFDVDQPVVPLHQPESSSFESDGRALRYVVEYPIGSLAPLADISIPVVPPRMPLKLPLPMSNAAALHVTDIRGDFQVTERIQEVSELLRSIQAGTTIAETRSVDVPLADLTDPDSNQQGGPTLDTEPSSFPLNQPGVNDGNFLTVAQGKLRVAESGVYTIQVRSSSGFALQIGDTAFTSVSGGGQLELTDSKTLYHTDFTGDADTRGVIPLAAGDHDLRFLHWSLSGQAYWEITSAVGIHAQDNDAQWLALGDDRTKAARIEVTPVKLVGPATISDVSLIDLPSDIGFEEGEELLSQASANGSALSRSDVTTLVLRDRNGICCHRPGAALDSADTFLWPTSLQNEGLTTSADNDFVSSIAGQLMVDDGDSITGESLTLTFGMFVADAARLHIDGVDFVATNGDASQLSEIDDDLALEFPYEASSADVLGVATLVEGAAYDFEGIYLEGSDDAGFELWAALGEHLDGFDADIFFPVSSTLVEWSWSRNVGLAFVSGGSQIDGDFDHDLQLTVGDLNLLWSAMGVAEPLFDLDQDGRVDHNDALVWIHDLKQTWVGDANLDGQFDTDDLVLIMTAGRFETGAAANWAEGDWNFDGYFGTDDLVFALQDGGFQAGLRAGAAAVPESFPMMHGIVSCLLLIGSRAFRQPAA